MTIKKMYECLHAAQRWQARETENTLFEAVNACCPAIEALRQALTLLDKHGDALVPVPDGEPCELQDIPEGTTHFIFDGDIYAAGYYIDEHRIRDGRSLLVTPDAPVFPVRLVPLRDVLEGK